MVPFVVVAARGEQRIESGHPWIYRADVGDVRAGAGDRVVVRNARGRTLGYALYSDRSQIAVRMLTLGDHPADDALMRRGSRRRSRFASRWRSTRPPTVWFTAKPICCRR